MSVETAPSAPLEESPNGPYEPFEMSTADLGELLKHREEEELAEDELAASYFEPGDPEKAADDRNRAIDYEILGKAVSLKHDINAKAGEAVSKVDQLFAKAKNVVGKPREMIRKWHMNRAEKSLKRKENRLAKKQQKWKHKLDESGSGRLHKYRQEKATKEIAKAEAKVDAFRTNRVERRQSDYREIVERRASRLEKSNSRQNERTQSATEARQKAVDRKAEAKGRKELRKRLRGPENNAGLLETRRVINEILGEENAPALLRQLGRDVISNQYAQRDLNRRTYELSNTKSRIERIPGLIAKEQREQRSVASSIKAHTRDLMRIEGVLNGKFDEDDIRSELEVLKASDDEAAVFTKESVRYIRSVIAQDTEQLERSRQRESELAEQLVDAEKRLSEQEQKALSAERVANRKSQNVDTQATTILS